MDMTTSIAAMSITMHQQQFQQDASIALAKKAMDIQAAESSAQLEMLAQTPAAPSVNLLDQYA